MAIKNQSVDLAKEYAGLIRTTLGSRVKELFLFGSQARGEAWEGSDFDCVVVVDARTPDVREAVLDADVEMMDRHNCLFSALIYSEQEWARSMQFPLGWQIQQEGIRL